MVKNAHHEKTIIQKRKDSIESFLLCEKYVLSD